MENCTCRIEHDDISAFNAIVILGFLPILSIMGMAANFLNIWVYSPSRSSADRYLMALSVSDFGVCASGVLVITADSLRPHNFFVDQLFVILLPKLIPFGLFFQMTSIYITVVAAVDCFVGVCRVFPKFRREYCSAKMAHRILIGVLLFSALYNVILFGELEAVECFSTEFNRQIYELCPTEMRLNEDYVVIYRGYMYAIMMAFLPFFLLSVLTTLIVWELSNQKAKRNNSIPQQYTNMEEEGTEEEEENSPIVLVFVVILFLGCSVVSLLVNIFDMFEGSLSRDVQMALIDVGNVLVVFNAAANFGIYITTSKFYRKSISRLFGYSILDPKTTRV